MDPKQKEAFDIALKGHNLLILGSAGTGKSYLVKEIKKQLESEGKSVQLTCSTGIACQVYEDACTIHKFTGISDGRYGPSEILIVLINNKKYDDIVQNIKKCDVLIVDECSMISSRTFDTINKACCLKCPDKPFGGIQVIFVGDFFQLPPVANINYQDDGSHCFVSPNFRNIFQHTVVLKTNMRQSEQSLITAINEIYRGDISPRSFEYISGLSRPLPVSASVKLFSKNDLVDDFNRQCLLNIPGEIYEFKAVDSGQTSNMKHLTAPKVLWLKKGAPVVLLRNLSETLVNGARGIVTNSDHDGPTVHFSTPDLTLRMEKMKFTVYSASLHEDIAVREQYPLKLAFGLTIHKSQGMTLDSVEIDCRDIFKAGQFGVALSRATSSAGLRVVNFHERYIIPPSSQVKQFMTDLPASEPLTDYTCCRERQWLASTEPGSLINQPSVMCFEPDDIDSTIEASDDSNLDDDFNDIIASINIEEDECRGIEIPEQFSLELEKTKFEKEVTEFNKNYNRTISNIEDEKLKLFLKKLFRKFQDLKDTLNVNEEDPKPIQEKKLAEFYGLAHKYSISSEYKLNCLIFFENEDSFTDVHQSVCYNILERVRLFFIQQKAKLFKLSERNVMKRTVTNACRARVRYVAGYCIAKLRNKYMKLKLSNMYSSSGQSVYEAAKCTLTILNVLKEDEQFLLSNSCEPDSLIDVSRRQNVKPSLTCVNDNLYQYFLELTDKSLSVLVNENLIKHGETMFAACLKEIESDSKLFETFSSIVVQGLCNVECDFQASENVSDLLQSLTLQSTKYTNTYCVP